MKKGLLVLFVILSPIFVLGQYRWEYGGKVGAANYLGELGGNEKTRRDFVYDMKLSKTRPDIGIFVRNKFKKEWAYRATASWLRIAGADSISTNPARRGRNLSFRNDIFEISADLQYVFYHPNDVARWGRKRVDFQSYILAGIAGYYSNPKAHYQGVWIPLQPLATEGVSYKKMGLALPMGLGMSYTIARKHRIGLELNYRHTFNDYLDDVSTAYPAAGTLTDPTAIALSNRNPELPANLTNGATADPKNYGPSNNANKLNKRGDPNHTDVYMGITVNYSYVIKGKNSFYRSKYNYITGVKRKFKKRRVRAKF